MANLRMTAGDTFTQDFAVQKKDGTPQSLVGATVKFAVGTQRKDGTIDAVLWIGVAGDGITITNASGGLLTVQAPKNTIKTVGVHRFELEVALPDSTSRTHAAGGLIVDPAVLPES